MTKNVNTVGDDLQSLQTASPFRIWVQNLWMENREERLVFGEDPVTIQQYWKTYKWWIKREYRHKHLQKAS
jgi:hypothetical protein